MYIHMYTHTHTQVTDYQGGCGPITCCTFTGEGKAVVGSENGLMMFDLRVPK